ncbi:hypothetical protein BDZ45DRAFT_722718 [Acephala macrosclerotiorum]|nr:hypothetical protein BDZ45DRAFT_722718 [Acephala macrosclerotiorum]
MPHYVSDLTYFVESELLQLRQEFITERCIFVTGERMRAIIIQLGAALDDFSKIQLVSDNLRQDPTLPFRKSKNGRFHYDLSGQGPPTLRRLEHQPFILSAEEDFVRHDSGQVRQFDEIDEDLQYNSVLHALFIFKTFMIQGLIGQFVKRPLLDYDTPDFICTLFNLRTVTSTTIVGEPALEGVHSDGVDFTMTTFLGSSNMTKDSAITFVHDNKETNGIRFDETKPEYLCGQVQHREFLDTLLFVDHERKHSLNPVVQVDPEKEATRDMLIFFTRKPVEKGHVSREFDSLREHKTRPLAVDLTLIK